MTFYLPDERTNTALEECLDKLNETSRNFVFCGDVVPHLPGNVAYINEVLKKVKDQHQGVVGGVVKMGPFPSWTTAKTRSTISSPTSGTMTTAPSSSTTRKWVQRKGQRCCREATSRRRRLRPRSTLTASGSRTSTRRPFSGSARFSSGHSKRNPTSRTSWNS